MLYIGDFMTSREANRPSLLLCSSQGMSVLLGSTSFQWVLVYAEARRPKQKANPTVLSNPADMVLSSQGHALWCGDMCARLSCLPDTTCAVRLLMVSHLTLEWCLEALWWFALLWLQGFRPGRVFFLFKALQSHGYSLKLRLSHLRKTNYNDGILWGSMRNPFLGPSYHMNGYLFCGYFHCYLNPLYLKSV